MQPINVNEYATLAQARVEPGAWDYFQGGSDDEITLRANCTAFEHIRLRPRMLVDVRTCDLSTTVLGTSESMPILVAPTGYHGLAHPEAECATGLAGLPSGHSRRLPPHPDPFPEEEGRGARPRTT